MTLVSIQSAAIITLLTSFYFWVRKQLTKERDAERKRYNQIQVRLRGIHYVLSEEETDMFERQRLFSEMEDLLDERRELLSA